MECKRTKRYASIIYKLAIVSLIAFCTKIMLIDLIKRTETDNLAVNQAKNSKLEYSEKSVDTENGSFNRPSFEDDYLDDYVSSFIDENFCQTLEYSVFEVGDGGVNVFLNCGVKDSIIYNYANKKRMAFKDITKNYDEFIKSSKRLLNLKYPNFVTDDVNFSQAIYDIKPNEMIVYYNTSQFGDLNIKINNNEIEGLMKYDMQYDDAYENEVYTLDPQKKAIAFTFDDGPGPYEIDLVDTLVASHASATFYLVGNRMKEFPSSIEYMIKNKMDIGNHTYDHKVLTTLSDEQIKNQITKTNETFFELTGQNLSSLRPSYGSINNRVRVQVGMPIVLWNIDTLDWKTRNPEKICEEILKNAKDGDIVLMHSIYPTTIEAVKKVLPELYKLDIQVTSVEELAKLKKYDLTNGKSILNIE